ncbi:hypothetical protein [Cardinium endosymbiont of Nabis limbatus]|uniref:hypothetical protein n=1 Tax=Cardinium endosymbiont of Nabis limbatus TaxID=3066217 RepID=UPI003AF3FBBC
MAIIVQKKFNNIQAHQGKPIKPPGLTVEFTADTSLKAGDYQLKIRIGKTGTGSRKTEQWIESTIHVMHDEAKNQNQETEESKESTVHVINDKAKHENQNEPSTEETIQALNNEETYKNDYLSEDKPNIVGPSSFTLTKNEITVNVEKPASIKLEATGNTEGYVIKSISVNKNGRYLTSKFNNIKAYQDQPIPSSGLTMHFTADTSLKAGDYQLKIKVGKKGPGSRQTEAWKECTIHVTNDAKK